MEKINWQDPEVKLRTDNREGMPDVITPDYGIGIKFKDDEGVEYTTVASERIREIDVNVHSWKGISFGAEHYYAKIEVDEPGLEYMENGELTRSHISGAFDRYKPDEVKDIKIEVKRKLTKEEIENGTTWGEDRWEQYKEGDLVHAFESQVELYNAIVDCIKARFAGEWLVNINGFDSQRYNKKVHLSKLKYFGEK